MLQAEPRHRLSHPMRFSPINRLRTSLRDRAESAPPRTDIAQQHESRSLVIPALANIGTLRRFTHGMQPQSASELLQIVEVISDWRFGPQPLRLGHARRWRQFNLD